ncbi:MAG: winged helix-turn-helix domain-containing protein [Candidatus Bathyarchaeia archaeon]|jgi:predicted transcriptional regulator
MPYNSILNTLFGESNKMTFQITDPKRRDKLIIMMDILSIAAKGATKTKIMLKANLSFSQLNEYISFLLKHGLLEDKLCSRKVMYKPTVRGIEFVERQQNVLHLISGCEKMPVIVCSGARGKTIVASLDS